MVHLLVRVSAYPYHPPRVTSYTIHHPPHDHTPNAINPNQSPTQTLSNNKPKKQNSRACPNSTFKLLANMPDVTRPVRETRMPTRKGGSEGEGADTDTDCLELLLICAVEVEVEVDD